MSTQLQKNETVFKKTDMILDRAILQPGDNGTA